jgi:ABC-type glutathione transport system ATPase component
MNLIWIIPAEGSGNGLVSYPSTDERLRPQSSTSGLRLFVCSRYYKPGRVFLQVVYATRMEVRSMEPPKLLVEGVSKTYRDGRKSLETLASIDLVVNAGEFVTVIGPSGCGKSTLFNIVAGVDRPTSGVVAIDGDTTGACG